ncbi:hypothetical protein GLW08_20380 [Pontibacillus yanchengensis]|uniref:Uncharacterized protein n=2 Tax=Pontibacillus yanchengensis TaxID=462910 RepID=A0ACC7VLH1_9BACI|nr:hypothetical protein [Pontibacillus yanchengensis]MYL35462.1 hypothetical protein [Pontibacillus yanchengensis]MYL55662.1 hypothetical protein [Pontibacillus yanchengensis]
MKKLLLIVFFLMFTPINIVNAYGTDYSTKIDYQLCDYCTWNFENGYYYDNEYTNWYASVDFDNYKLSTRSTLKGVNLEGTIYDNSDPYWRETFFQDGDGDVVWRGVKQHGEFISNSYSWDLHVDWSGVPGTFTAWIVSDWIGGAGNTADEIGLVHELHYEAP